MTINQKTRNGKTYMWGVIWGTPRCIAEDEAKLRHLRRLIERLAASDEEVAA